MYKLFQDITVLSKLPSNYIMQSTEHCIYAPYISTSPMVHRKPIISQIKFI